LDSRILLKELLSRGAVTADQVEQAISVPERRGEALERILVDEGVVAEDTLLELMSELYGLPLVQLTPEILDIPLAMKLPARMLEECCVYPLQKTSGSEVLPLATADPFNVLAEDAVRQLTGRQVRLVLAPKDQILSAIKGKWVSGDGFRLMVEHLPERDGLEGLDDVLQAAGASLSENDGPIIQLVNSILRDAIRLGASDIHIEPQEDNFRVRYRIDGILRTIVEMPKRVERTCISRIKIMGGLDIAESRKAQDGRLAVRRPEGGKVNMRLSTVPADFGEKAVLRILDQSSVQLDLGRLGLSPSALETLGSQIASSSGMILVTGPTGSGKTSTLYAILRLLNSPDVNIVTVEDPIEFQVPGLTQVGVHPKAGVTFASALRAFLRQDPDIIMVGEIRDLETVETAVQAAQTGHLVLSTLHTNDAPGTLARLVLMGAEPHSVADSLLCVVAQRLVRRICPYCKILTQPKPEHTTLLNLAIEAPKLNRAFEGQGCDKCGDTGFRGRFGLYEILTVTSSIRQQMLVDPTEHALWKVARAEGMVTLLEDGLSKVEAGDTTLDEVLRVVTVRRQPPPTAVGPPVAASAAGRTRAVRHLMSSKMMVVEPDTLLTDVARLCLQKGLTGCPVVSPNGTLLGVVTLSDLVAAKHLPERGRAPQVVREVMSSRIISVGPDETPEAAAQLLWRHKVHRLLVLEHEKLVGIVTPFDLMMA
jgi:type IV pilus assembly protein PilB